MNDKIEPAIEFNYDRFKHSGPVLKSGTSSDKKLNIKFNPEDLELLTCLAEHYQLKNKHELMEQILVAYFRKSLNEGGVARDVALMIAMVADECSGLGEAGRGVDSWEHEIISKSDLTDNILNYGPTGKKIKLSTHGGVEHSQAFIHVGMKLLRFCDKFKLLGSPTYKRLFDSIRCWNELIKKDRQEK